MCARQMSTCAKNKFLTHGTCTRNMRSACSNYYVCCRCSAVVPLNSFFTSALSMVDVAIHLPTAESAHLVVNGADDRFHLVTALARLLCVPLHVSFACCILRSWNVRVAGFELVPEVRDLSQSDHHCARGTRDPHC